MHSVGCVHTDTSALKNILYSKELPYTAVVDSLISAKTRVLSVAYLLLYFSLHSS